MDTPHWTELPSKELLQNRRDHLMEVESDLAVATHPIDIENIQMDIGRTRAVIAFEEECTKLFPDRR